MDPVGLHGIPGKAPDTGSLQSKHTRTPRVQDPPPTPASPRRRCPVRRLTGARPRPGPPAPAGRPRPGAEGPAKRAAACWGPGCGTRAARPRGCASGSRGERMLGAGPRWGRGPLPGLSLTASRSSQPGLRGGPPPAVTARLPFRGSTPGQGARSWGKGCASGGLVASGAEGVGKMERSLAPPPRTLQTRLPPAPLSHGSCGPSHHTHLPPPTRPAARVTEALTNQRP